MGESCKKNTLEFVVCKIAAIFSILQCVKIELREDFWLNGLLDQYTLHSFLKITLQNCTKACHFSATIFTLLWHVNNFSSWSLMWQQWTIALILQCTCPISHNAPLWNRNVHISVPKWCIVGYGTGALWDLWIWSFDVIQRWDWIAFVSW